MSSDSHRFTSVIITAGFGACLEVECCPELVGIVRTLMDEEVDFSSNRGSSPDLTVTVRGDDVVVDEPTGPLCAPLLSRKWPRFAACIGLMNYLEAALAARSESVALHGGAVSIDGKGVALLQSRGSGKTTLLAALINEKHGSGDVGYIADDLVFYRDGIIKGVPFPMRMRRMHVDGISFSGSVLAEVLDEEGQIRSLYFPPCRVVRDEVPLRAVILPEFNKGSAGRIDALSPSTSFQFYLANCRNHYSNLGLAVPQLVHLSRNVAAYRVVFGNLREGLQLSLSILGGGSGYAKDLSGE